MAMQRSTIRARVGLLAVIRVKAPYHTEFKLRQGLLLSIMQRQVGALYYPGCVVHFALVLVFSATLPRARARPL